MASPFKALEDRVNNAVNLRLSNADATATTRFGEVVQFQVIFDNGYAAFIGGMAEATQPSCLARTVDVADLEQGGAIDIGADLWKVVGTEPDGTGMTTLRLRKP